MSEDEIAVLQIAQQVLRLRRSRPSISPQELATLMQTRTGAAVSADLARKYGWKIGDKVPIQTKTLQTDGNPV